MKPAPKLLVYILLITGAIVFSIPFLWTVTTALKTPENVFAYPPQWIPHPARWDNFAKAWTVLPFPRFVLNTVFITFVCTIAQVISGSLVAYGFARFQFRARNAMFYTMLATMMLPGPVSA